MCPRYVMYVLKQLQLHKHTTTKKKQICCPHKHWMLSLFDRRRDVLSALTPILLGLRVLSRATSAIRTQTYLSVCVRECVCFVNIESENSWPIVEKSIISLSATRLLGPHSLMFICHYVIEKNILLALGF